jgi:hypothetical protein
MLTTTFFSTLISAEEYSLPHKLHWAAAARLEHGNFARILWYQRCMERFVWLL